jgi:hypothetical protein
VVITSDCGSENPGSIPGGGNFLLYLILLAKHIIDQSQKKKD